jgi:hypothetical protein
MTNLSTRDTPESTQDPKIFFLKKTGETPEEPSTLFMGALNEAGKIQMQALQQEKTPSSSDFTALNAEELKALQPSVNRMDSTGILYADRAVPEAVFAAKISSEFMADVLFEKEPIRIRTAASRSLNDTAEIVVFKQEDGSIHLGAINAEGQTELKQMMSQYPAGKDTYQPIPQWSVPILKKEQDAGEIPSDVITKSIVEVSPKFLETLMAPDTLLKMEIWTPPLDLPSIPKSPQRR